MPRNHDRSAARDQGTRGAAPYLGEERDILYGGPCTSRTDSISPWNAGSFFFPNTLLPRSAPICSVSRGSLPIGARNGSLVAASPFTESAILFAVMLAR